MPRVWLDRTVTLFAARILPFDAAAARHWGRVSATLGHDGADLLIAATALASVVTCDGDFAADEDCHAGPNLNKTLKEYP